MATILQTINPVVAGTNVPIKSTFAVNPPDWLELANDSPFQMNAYAQGNLNTPIMSLTPFETNAYPINQLLPIRVGLKIITVNLVLIASHYYIDPSTENNSPTNICIVRQLSNAEAQTNHYPAYSSRMNTTVATIANSLVNTGNPPADTIIFAMPVGDTSTFGAVNINNQGQAIFGDATYNGSVTFQGTDSANCDISRNAIAMFSAQGQEDILIQPGYIQLNGATSGFARIYQVFSGTYKYIIVQFSNFRNGSGANQFLPLPTSFTFSFIARLSDAPTMQFNSGGPSITVNNLTTLGNPGTTTPITAIGGNTLITGGPFDTIQFNSGQASSHTGLMILEGI